MQRGFVSVKMVYVSRKEGLLLGCRIEDPMARLQLVLMLMSIITMHMHKFISLLDGIDVTDDWRRLSDE